MKAGKPSWTAEITAIYRAVESRRPAGERIVHDPFARLFIRPMFRQLLKSRLLTRAAVRLTVERRFPGGMDTILARIRYVEDCLKTALNNGVRQVVILGAGYDSRAYRFRKLLDGKRVYEVDHPDTQRRKKQKVAAILGALPPHVVYVPVDFEREGFEGKLAASGFDSRQPSFFVWEGVSKYLTPQAATAVLDRIKASGAAGSQVVFDYLFKAMLDGRMKDRLTGRILDYQRKKGEPYLFGIEQGHVETYLARAGFSHAEDIAMGDLTRRYFNNSRRAGRIHRYMGIALATV